MTSLSTVFNPAAYHILSYGTLLGTSIFQSFIGGVIAFKRLTRPQFSQLQQGIFPIYFAMQTLLPVSLGLTLPTCSSPIASLNTLFSSGNRYTILLPIATMTVCGLANWALIGPATTKTMRERKHQETKDGKKYFDQGPQSDEMKRLNKRFAQLHGASSLVNLMQIIVSVYYGFVLAERLG